MEDADWADEEMTEWLSVWFDIEASEDSVNFGRLTWSSFSCASTTWFFSAKMDTSFLIRLLIRGMRILAVGSVGSDALEMTVGFGCGERAYELNKSLVRSATFS